MLFVWTEAGSVLAVPISRIKEGLALNAASAPSGSLVLRDVVVEAQVLGPLAPVRRT